MFTPPDDVRTVIGMTVASDAAAAERLVERVMLQAIRAIEGDAVTGTLRGLMIALMDHEIARNLPRHFH